MKIYITYILLFLIMGAPQLRAQDLSINECNEWSPLQWDQYLKESLIPSSISSGALQFNDDFKALQSNCSQALEKPEIQACLDRIKGYYQAFLFKEGHHFSARMNNEDYYKQQPQNKMDLPEEFKNTPYGLPQNWKEVAQQKGWKWIQFQSNTSDQIRTIFVIQKNGYKQLLVFYRYPDDKPAHRQKALQMQVIEDRIDPNHGRLVHYRHFEFTGPQHQPQAATQMSDRCIQCHSNGPLRINPKRVSNFPTQMSPGMSLEQINNLIVIDQPMDMRPFLDVSKLPRHLAVGSQHSCSECHNGIQRNSLALSQNYSGTFNDHMNRRLVVEDRTMPKYSKIDWPKAHREQILTDLKRDFDQKLSQWLSETSCQPQSLESTTTESHK